MERRHFLKLVVGVAAGAAAMAASAQAAPLLPQSITRNDRLPGANEDVHAAVTSEAEVEHLKPEQVRWGHHHWHRHWHRRHWGWHHRHWGWHRHRWHHRHWHRRYW